MTTPTRATLELPWDLSDWVSRGQLLSWALEEVDSLDWTNQELQETLRVNPGFQPRMLLVLLIYAYSLGICESQEIVDLFYEEPALRAPFPRRDLSPSALTRFRREHRGLVKWGLVQVFKRALRVRYELGEHPLPPGVRRVLSDLATHRLDAARHMDRSVHGE